MCKPNFDLEQSDYQVQWLKLNSNQVAMHTSRALSLLDHLSLRVFPSEPSERHMQTSIEMTGNSKGFYKDRGNYCRKGRVCGSTRKRSLAWKRTAFEPELAAQEPLVLAQLFQARFSITTK